MTRPLGEISTTDSLGDLFEHHADHVYGYAFKHCGQRSLAEDVTAQAFEAASRRFSGGQGHQVTLPWLFTVTRRRLIDHWRAEARRSDRLEQLRNEVLVRSHGEPSEDSGVIKALDV